MSPIPTLSSLSATTITLYLAISVAHHTSSPAQEAGPTRPARPTQGRLSQHRPAHPGTAPIPHVPPGSPGAVANLARPTRPTQGRLSQHRPGPASSLASPELAPSEAAAAIAAGAAETAGAG